MDVTVLREFAERRFGGVADVSVSPVRGGLETGVVRVSVRLESGATAFAVKHLAAERARELKVHLALEQATVVKVAPKILGWRNRENGGVSLYLEWVPAFHRWPWRDPRHVESVIEKLAHVHALDPSGFEPDVSGWDYETELADSAETTLLAYMAVGDAARPFRRPMMRTLERLAGDLGAIRRELLAFGPKVLLHGDMHSANAIVRKERDGFSVVLLDWGRARLGSPLEDLCGWLQSLGFWEYQARRTHDTFVQRYLNLAGWSTGHTREFRDAYWMAGASNAFAGALRYHLAVMADSSRTKRERDTSWGAAEDWLRILRRADACRRA